ncbi:methyltransferase domain-containing protein [Geminocystis sp. GBBB08]|uniref:methyltransferase domain-containing protein n=1 Tax=Geminocystis sp. GBBB08 TaxID=2604140 RepID=UPI0027E2A783|nr:methyltransferase domain-containing protein [Geminocystis sp. GBBB08]MBL1210786.1 class I SAM-dependent methyltransferase [Geminocystis sp. GBBB08]
MVDNFLGKLIRTDFVSNVELDDISTYDLGCELLKRLEVESDNQSLSHNEINLFSTLEKILNQRLEIFENRFSLKWLRGQFYASYHYWQNHQIPLKDATYIEIGAGAINPFSFMFLYLMLGAKKCFCLEPDSLVNKPLILSNLAETVGKLLINPKGVILNYPITKEEIISNISTFNLSALLKGKEEGLDSEKLVYLPESLFNNSIPNETADVLITVSVLEHLPDLDLSLQEIGRITKTGGYGLHNIDGMDHEYYQNSNIHPLDFLRVDTDEKIVGVCNRIRPLNFIEIFERNGFKVLEVRPYNKMEISSDLRSSFAEPFRSMDQDLLEVIQAYFLVQKT